LPAALVEALRARAGARDEPIEHAVEDLLRLGLRAARETPA
jgi:hypothetical protein